jgi:drug/metabolite transporter, DME family
MLRASADTNHPTHALFPMIADASSAQNRKRGRVLVGLSGAVMSLGAPLIRLLEEADAWQFLTFRSFAVIAVVSIWLVVRYGRNVTLAFRAGGFDALLGGALLSVAFVAIVFSFLSTTIANALLLLSTAPLMTALLGWMVLGERPSKWYWGAIAIAIIGAFIMVADGVARGDVFGDAMALCAAMGFACYSVVIRRGRHTDMLPAVFYAGIISAVVASVGAVTIGIGLQPNAWDIGVSLCYGAVGISGGLILYTLGSKHLPAAELNVLSLGEVVLGPLWVWLAFAETPTTQTLVGGAVILSAVALQASGSMWSEQQSTERA